MIAVCVCEVNEIIPLFCVPIDKFTSLPATPVVEIAVPEAVIEPAVNELTDKSFCPPPS